MRPGRWLVGLPAVRALLVAAVGRYQHLTRKNGLATAKVAPREEEAVAACYHRASVALAGGREPVLPALICRALALHLLCTSAVHVIAPTPGVGRRLAVR